MREDDTTKITVLPDLPQSFPVLLVDDDDLVRAHLAELLRQAGYLVYAAASAREALDHLETSPCPLVLTDWEMPETDGLELCRQLRAQQSDGYCYIVVLTGRSGTDAMLAGLAAGADDYVCKSAPFKELLARLLAGRRVINLERSLRRANRDNRTLAHTDALTGAFNRRYLIKYLARELERSHRYGRPVAVVACDIDHFKQVNDTYGHGVGDEVLRGVVECMQGLQRTDIDWIARTGGEEFVIVMPETSLDGAAAAAERVRAGVSATAMQTSAGPLHVTISAGVAGTPAQSGPVPVDQILQLADRGLYASKQSGRNRVTALGASSGDAARWTSGARSMAPQC